MFRQSGASDPTWEEIEDAILLLAQSDGRIELYEKNAGQTKGSQGLWVAIQGTPGTYMSMIQYNFRNYYESDTKILTDETTEPSGDTMVVMFGDVCQGSHTVNDLDAIAVAIKTFLEEGKFVDNKPFVWIDF